jgi:hypothetical protein
MILQKMQTYSNNRCSIWKFRSAGIHLKNETRIYRQKNIEKYKQIHYILISAGMKFRNKKKFLYGMPAHTGPFRALLMSNRSTECYTNCCYLLTPAADGELEANINVYLQPT